MDTPPPLWVDCDTGIDDALALLYLARAGGRLVGASTLAGNCPLEDATANTLGVLSLAGAGDVPVHPGAVGPLGGQIADARHVHGGDGLGGCRPLLPAAPAPSATGAGDALAAALREARGQLTILATGPLTNLALLLRRDPTAARLARHVVVMGGTMLAPGNVAPQVEFNFGYDPEAAAEVLGAPWPVTIVGLDVTQEVTARPGDIAQLSAGRDAVAQFAARLLASYSRAYQSLGRPAAVPLHDPLAAMVALRPDVVDSEEWPLTVETGGSWTRGMLVVDRRTAPGDLVPPRAQRVALRVRAEVARAALVAAWDTGV